MDRNLLTVAQAAERLGCSEDTVRRLIHGGQLPAVNVSARLTRLFPEDVEAYLRSRTMRTAALQKKNRPRMICDVRGGINNSGYYPGMKVV